MPSDRRRNERPAATKASHEQAKLKQDVITRPEAGHFPLGDKVVWCKDKDREVVLWQSVDQALQETLSYYERALVPNLRVCSPLQAFLQRLCDLQTLR